MLCVCVMIRSNVKETASYAVIVVMWLCVNLMIVLMDVGLPLRILVSRGRLFVGNDFIYHLLIYLFAFLLFVCI